MKIAKGKLLLSFDELFETFGIPNDIDVIDVRIDEARGIEFVVASAEPIDKYTYKIEKNLGYDVNSYRSKILRKLTEVVVDETDTTKKGIVSYE